MVFKLNVRFLHVVDLVNEEVVEGLGTISSDMTSDPTASAGCLSVVEAILVTCFLLPRAAASLGSSTVSYAGQVKLQK